MAHDHKTYRRLIRLSIVVILFVVFASPSLFAAYRQPAKTHFTSSELNDRPREYKKLISHKMSSRRFKVSRDRVAKLKKSSFWNKRPYQFSTPAYEGDMLYVGSDSGHFYGINTAKEDKIWDYKTAGAVAGKAMLENDIVYFGDSKAFAYALKTSDGSLLWQTQLDNEIMSTPLIVGQRLFITDMSGRLYALDKSSGVAVWHTEPADRNIGFSVRKASSPVYASGLIIVGNASGSLIAYREGDGQIMWARQLGNRMSQFYDVDSTPLVIGDKVYASSADERLFCLEASTGKIVWDAQAGGANDLLLHDNKIYASGGGVLSALDPQNGNIFWQQDLETPEISAPAAGNHFITVATTKDKLYMIDCENGSLIFQRFIRKGSFGDPVVVNDNKLFVLANTGALYSFGVRELPPKKVKQPKTTNLNR